MNIRLIDFTRPVVCIYAVTDNKIKSILLSVMQCTSTLFSGQTAVAIFTDTLRPTRRKERKNADTPKLTIGKRLLIALRTQPDDKNCKERHSINTGVDN